MSVFGYRWWEVGKTGQLQSVNKLLWPPNEPLEAVHEFDPGVHPGQKAPVFDCMCGYWAFWDPELASTLPSHGSFAKQCNAFGVVEAWGKLIRHEYGFRAQFMVPRAVVVLRGKLHAAYDIQRYTSIASLLEIWDNGGSDENNDIERERQAKEDRDAAGPGG